MTNSTKVDAALLNVASIKRMIEGKKQVLSALTLAAVLSHADSRGRQQRGRPYTAFAAEPSVE